MNEDRANQQMNDFLQALDKYECENPRLRRGQCIMNVVTDLYPTFALSIMGSEKDIFYIETTNHPKIDEFWKDLHSFFRNDG